MPKLTNTPREIRDQIYGYCLIVDGEIMPYDEYYLASKKERAAPPNLSLLKVNKMVRAEAMEIFYGKNTWRIGPSGPRTLGAVDSSCPNRLLWGTYKDLFRHVIVYFTQFDINPDSAYKYARLKNDEYLDATPTSRRAMFHNTNQALMSVTWAKKTEFIGGMNALSSLVLDVERLFCFSGCCHRNIILKELLEDLKDDMQALSHTGCTIEVRGLHNQNEVTEVLKEWSYATIQQVGDRALNAAN